MEGGGLREAEHFWSACEAQLATRAWQGLGMGCHIPGKSPDLPGSSLSHLPASAAGHREAVGPGFQGSRDAQPCG